MSQSDADEEEISEVESFVIDQEELDKHSVLASKLALLAATGQTSSLEALDGDSSIDECISVDAETQARLEALLEAAGIGKLSTADGKAFAEPEVLRRLTSSVSCALDEAAAALSRMRAETGTQKRTLAEACSDGDINTVKRLLGEGSSVHETTEDGESLLSLACSAGYYELAEVLLSVPPLCHESVYLQSESANILRNKMNSDFLQTLNYQLTKVLLAMHAHVEDRGSKGECTPLMEAASGGYKDIVQLLLRNKANVNAKSSTGNTALAFACCGGYVDIVKILIDAGAELEVHNENGHTPLMEAASGGHVEVAALLLQHGVGINTHSNEFKESALTLACYKGHLEMVRFLLEAGADQEHKTDEMHTALMEASMDGHVDVARLLLDSGAQVNMPADSFESPLTLAACGGHVELASLLLERGASLEEVNDEGYTPLMEAAREGHEEMVAVLLGHCANVNAQTEETQETALTLACCGGFLDCAELLVQFNADLELGCSTPLMEAAQEGHLELVKYLIKAGADVNHSTSSGETALTVACEHGHTDIADVLLKAGANLEQEAEGGRTPLMKAARAGQYCMVQYLISQGADVNRTTRNNDHSVLSLSCVYGHLPVVELLLQYGADSTHVLKDGSTMLLEAAKGGHSAVVQCLLDYAQNLYNNATPSLPDNQQQVTSTTQEESVPRVPTQSLPMIVPPQEPDKSPCVHKPAQLPVQKPANNFDAANILTGSEEFPSIVAQPGGNSQFRTVPEASRQQEPPPPQSAVDQNNLRNAKAYAGSVKPIPPPPLSVQNSFANANVATNSNVSSPGASQQPGLDPTDSLLPLLSVDKEVRVHVESFLRSMTSGTAGKGLPKRTAESIVEEAQGKLTELEQRIKEAIEKNAQLKSLELLQTDQLTKEKVEEMYKTREEQIQKKQKILEELQKVRAAFNSNVERELQLKTQQQLKKHYLEAKSKESSPTEPTALEPGQPPLQKVPLHRGKPDGEDSPMCSSSSVSKVFPQPTPSISPSLLPPESTPLPENNLSVAAPPVPTVTTTLPSNTLTKEKKMNNQKAAETMSAGKPYKQLPVVTENIPPKKEPMARPQKINNKEFQRAVDTPLPSWDDASDSSDEEVYAPQHHHHHPHIRHTHECNHHPCTTPHLTHRSTPSPHQLHGESPAYRMDDTRGHYQQPNDIRNVFPALNIDCFTESNHDTPLTLACAGGHEDLVQLLISRGARIEHRDKKGFTPLILAATAGHVGIVQILLDAGADIESQSERTKDTPLSLACSGGREDVVRLLLERGANREHRNVSDYTPLSLAASGGYVNIIKLLLNYNAEINSRTGSKLGISPLMLAAMNGHTTAVQLLLDMGADINAQIETNRNTALTLACFQGRHEVVEILVDRKANVEHRAKTGLTPLMEAASGGYAEVGKVLLAKGADVNAPPVPSSRDTALTIAADKGHYRFCELVLSIWAAVDARNKKGNTPLWLACNGGHLDVAQLLVEHDADVNAADNRNITPLMAAFRKGHYKVVRWIVNEVSQFPSDEECMRYLTSIAHDRELFSRGRQCMEYIESARERQAQEANKFASELLLQIDLERSREENRRERAARKRVKRRLRRKQKSNQDSKKNDEQEDDENIKEEMEEALPKDDKSSTKKTENSKKNLQKEATEKVQKGKNEKENVTKETKQNILKSAENIQPKPIAASTTEAAKPTKKPESLVTMTTASITAPTPTNTTTPSSNDAVSRKSKKPSSANPVAKEVENVQVSKPKTTPDIKKSEPVPEQSKARTPAVPQVEVAPVISRSAPPSQKKASTSSRRSNSKQHLREHQSSSTKPRTNSQSHSNTLVTTTPSPGKRGQRRDEGWKEVVRSNSHIKSKCVMVSSSSISRVIGRGGCNINTIREVTGAHIDIDKQRRGGHERTVTIKGGPKSIRHAHQLISELTKPDRTDEEVAQIIAAAKAEAAANAAASASSTSTTTATTSSPATSTQTSLNQRPIAVVEAPLPTRPAWTVPPSIISKQPVRPGSAVAVTHSHWTTTSTSTYLPEPQEKAPELPNTEAAPTVESVKKVLFAMPRLPTATSSTGGRSSNSSSACSTPVPPPASNASPSIVAKPSQQPTTFASVSPSVQTTTTTEVKPIQQPAATITSTASKITAQSQPLPVTFATKSADKAVSRPVQPVAPMVSVKAMPQQQSYIPQASNSPMPMASINRTLPPGSQQMIPASPGAIPSSMQYASPSAMRASQPQTPNNVLSMHSNFNQTPNPMQDNQHQNAVRGYENGMAIEFANQQAQAVSRTVDPGYSHFRSPYTNQANSVWNAENNHGPMNPPMPEGIPKSHDTGIIGDQAKAPGYRGALKSPAAMEAVHAAQDQQSPPVKDELRKSSGSVDSASHVSPKADLHSSPSNENKSDMNKIESNTPPSDRKIWPIGTERAFSQRRNTGSSVKQASGHTSVGEPNIWCFKKPPSNEIEADVVDWSTLTGNQEIVSDGMAANQQSPASVTNNPEGAVSPVIPLESQENILSSRLPLYPGPGQDTLTPQTSQAMIANSAAVSLHASQSLHSSAGLGTQPPIGSHLGSNSQVYLPHQQQQQPIGAHLGNGVRSSAYLQQQQRNYNAVIRNTQPIQPQQAFAQQMQNELPTTLGVMNNKQHWQHRPIGINNYQQQQLPTSGLPKFNSTSDPMFKGQSNLAMSSNDNLLQNQDLYYGSMMNNTYSQQHQSPSGLYSSEKIGVIGGGYGSAVPNSTLGSHVSANQMHKRNFPMQNQGHMQQQFDSMANMNYPHPFKQDVLSNSNDTMMGDGNFSQHQQNTMGHPAMWEMNTQNNPYHQQHLQNNYRQFSGASVGMNGGLDNDVTLMRGSQGVVGHPMLNGVDNTANTNNFW